MHKIDEAVSKRKEECKGDSYYKLLDNYIKPPPNKHYQSNISYPSSKIKNLLTHSQFLQSYIL